MICVTVCCVISGSADDSVSLWRVASCSSAPWLGDEVDDMIAGGNSAESGAPGSDSSRGDMYQGAYEGYGEELGLSAGGNASKKQVSEVKCVSE